MTITWLLVANRTRARVLEIQSERDKPTERAAFVNPAGRTHERDLESDAAGRFYGKGEREQGHSATASESLGEHETDRFVIDLREFLDHARSEQRFERLWLIAAPALLGQLRSAFSKPLRQRVELEIDKDLTTDTPAEILRRALDARNAKRARERASEQS
ncbi:MAG TPA: host attachment protein [Casimicrobiaceae bacterium]